MVMGATRDKHVRLRMTQLLLHQEKHYTLKVN
jgi:hypothetical protein